MRKIVSKIITTIEKINQIVKKIIIFLILPLVIIIVFFNYTIGIELALIILSIYFLIL